MGWKKVVVGVGVAIAATAVGFGAVKSGKIKFLLPIYTVSRVIDGDTFVTKEGQYIRLSGADAPEPVYCMGSEAKTGLEKLIIGKKVYLKVVFKDRYSRLVSLVYTPEGYVNEKMLALGLAVYSRGDAETGPSLQAAAERARNSKFGIYSSKCTQEVNLKNSKCNIKGNIYKGQKYYRYPGCGQYNNTIVQLHLGEQWFCSELEAKKTGFVKGGDCP